MMDLEKLKEKLIEAERGEKDEEFFCLKNVELREWMRENSDSDMAKGAAKAMRTVTIWWCSMNNEPMQDYLAELYAKGYGSIESAYDIPNKVYVETLLDAFSAMIKHYEDGRKLGLCDEEISLYDEIWGKFLDNSQMSRFSDEEAVAAAKELYELSEAEYAKLNLEGMDKELYFMKQPKKYYDQMAQFEQAFSDKCLEIDKKYGFGLERPDNGFSIELAYLISHSHIKCYGGYTEHIC